jgi:uncharacterized membrane protein
MACFSCGYNKKEAVTPVPNQNSNNNVNGGNTTVAVSYKTDISPIVQDNCVSCHGNLSTYSNLTKYTSSSVVGKVSELEGRIKGIENWPKMPKGGSLTQPEIDKITQWINEGAKDN